MKCLGLLNAQVNMEARFAKVMNEVKYIVSIYSKDEQILVVAYEDVANEKTLLLSDQVTTDEVKDNLEIENDVLVLNNENRGMKLVFSQNNSFPLANCDIFMIKEYILIEFTSKEATCIKQLHLSDM